MLYPFLSWAHIDELTYKHVGPGEAYITEKKVRNNQDKQNIMITFSNQHGLNCALTPGIHMLNPQIPM